MKRILIITLVFCLLFTAACDSAENIKSQFKLLLQLAAHEVEIDADYGSLWYDKDTPVDGAMQYTQIRDTISDESYQMLMDIYNTYGITVHLLTQYNGINLDEKTHLQESEYNAAILTVYEALTVFGDDPSTIAIIDKYIDHIFCYDTITMNGLPAYYLSDTNDFIFVLAGINEGLDYGYYTSCIMGHLGNCIAEEIDLEAYGFADYPANGFIGYDEDVTEEDQYLNILAKNQIVDYTDIQIELFRAGILRLDALPDITADFSVYAAFLAAPESSHLHQKYYLEPIQTKMDIAIQVLEDVNPAWTKAYFLNLFPYETSSASSPRVELLMSFSRTLFLCHDYAGTYQNNSGIMNANLSIKSIDNDTGAVNAIFTFSPGEGNTAGKSGSYEMQGELNFVNAELSLAGTEWITAPPENYEMLSFSGLMFACRINAEIDREYLPEIVLFKVE